MSLTPGWGAPLSNEAAEELEARSCNLHRELECSDCLCAFGNYGCDTFARNKAALLEGSDGEGNWFCADCRQSDEYAERQAAKVLA